MFQSRMAGTFYKFLDFTSFNNFSLSTFWENQLLAQSLVQCDWTFSFVLFDIEQKCQY